MTKPDPSTREPVASDPQGIATEPHHRLQAQLSHETEAVAPDRLGAAAGFETQSGPNQSICCKRPDSGFLE